MSSEKRNPFWDSLCFKMERFSGVVGAAGAAVLRPYEE